MPCIVFVRKIISFLKHQNTEIFLTETMIKSIIILLNEVEGYTSNKEPDKTNLQKVIDFSESEQMYDSNDEKS